MGCEIDVTKCNRNKHKTLESQVELSIGVLYKGPSRRRTGLVSSMEGRVVGNERDELAKF